MKQDTGNTNDTFLLGVKRIPFNGKMREARQRLGFTQKRLAETLGMSVQYIQNLELLKRFPKDTEAFAIADVLKADAVELFPKWMSKNIIKPASNFNYFMELERVAFDSKEVLQLESSNTAMELAEKEDLKRVISEVLDTLNERERKIISFRFGFGNNGETKTLGEVAKEFGVTRERIRQIEAKALRKLRHPSRRKKLQDYLE